ncbi:MAG: bis(5'-nucleosyl)-tetraphosphatase (symmetrical) YqeK [Halanaerobiales bacterium]|nr:bis(5'-nucleosyl)-tetraphosphatase (symmetrical) YqeK [Halanaerobiales bacterium]
MYNIKFIEKKLKEENNFRLEHTLSVKNAAVELAKTYNEDKNKTEIAALLHDYAKPYNTKKLFEIINKNKISVDRWEKSIPILLHAPVGAFLAKKLFDIRDKNILNAIRYHTIGRPQMSNLEKIIFVADIIEPGRDFPGVELIRKNSKKDLDTSVKLVCDFTIKYNINKNRIIHPNTLLIRNEILEGEW